MLTTPTIMLKAPYSSLSLLFEPLKRAQIIYNIFVSYKKTKALLQQLLLLVFKEQSLVLELENVFFSVTKME